MLKDLSDEELGKNLRSCPLWPILLEMEKENEEKAATEIIPVAGHDNEHKPGAI